MPRLSGRTVAASCLALVVLLGALAVAARGGRPEVRFDLPRDAREDAPLRIAVHGTVRDGDVFATVARACSPRTGSAIASPVPVAGRFTFTGEAEVGKPGSYAVCAWHRRDGKTDLVGRTTLRVRAGRSSIGLKAPASADWGMLEVAIRGSVEQPATVVFGETADPSVCDPVRPRLDEIDLDEVTTVTGRFATRASRFLGSETGRVHLCAALREPDTGRVLAVARRPLVKTGL